MVVLAVVGYLLVQIGFQLGPLGASFPPNLVLDPIVAVALGAAVLGERVPLDGLRLAGYLVCTRPDRLGRGPAGRAGPLIAVDRQPGRPGDDRPASVTRGSVKGQSTFTMSRATLDKKPREVAAMFDGVAKRYDLTNTVLSFGQDRRWRHKTREALALTRARRCWTSRPAPGCPLPSCSRSGAYAVASDFSLGMLRAGTRRPDRRQLPFVAADALHLPFADASFDAVTISSGCATSWTCRPPWPSSPG